MATESDSEAFPDGGFQAWVVVFGVRKWGYINSWGIFQVYYQEIVLPRSSESEISWIGSVQSCMIFLPGVFIGRLFDIGYFRLPFATGSILIIVGTFLIPLCQLYWHFILCQGLIIGLGCGLTFGNSGVVITHWWRRRRGLAFGIAASGAAVGGTFFPLVMRKLLQDLGFPWTCRIIGFVLIVTLGIANLCLTRRLPPHNADVGLFGLHVFRNTAFSVYCLSCFLTALGTFTVTTYISTSALFAGLSETFAFYLVAILNGGSGLGGIVFGFYGDRLGAMNVLIQGITAVGIITIAWPFCRTVASLSVIALLYGFASGAWIALVLVPVAAMGGTEDLGRRLGVVNTVLGLGALCGPPLGGLLTSTSIGYEPVGYFSGLDILRPPILGC
ncbi:MFS general substrate transporter [Mycena rosella]|uniref:MFS general substrate transporter n=1 Tax=Mycena rosella TaxID=1033263 RepID=A0AAD7DSW9_MYCRO|nr:MFS general substrate transporter [Mycena rosella]